MRTLATIILLFQIFYLDTSLIESTNANIKYFFNNLETFIIYNCQSNS